jgi:uncharacterized membrane protein YeaQ/YmgE (transglycosylase-associated protein family)
MKVIYSNIIFFALLIIGLVGAAIDRSTTDFWDDMPEVKIKYDIIWGTIGLFVAFTTIGMLFRKRWAYQLAIAINGIFTLLPIMIFATNTVMFWNETSIIDSIINYSLHLIVAVIAGVFAVSLMFSKNVKNAYNKSFKPGTPQSGAP